MSMWTHIYAMLIVDTCRDQFIDDMESADLSAVQLLENAPHITGSEGDAEIFVNPSEIVTGHSKCDMCPYYKRDDKGLYCVLEETRNDEDYKTQICENNPHTNRKPIIVITIAGHLRDRDKASVKKEYDNFKKFIRLLHWDITKSHCELIED